MHKTICILLLTALGYSANSQEKKTLSVYQTYPGYIITNANDTIRGIIQYRTKEDNQSKCIFFLNANDKNSMKTYKPSELKGYTVEDQHYKSLNYSGNIGIGKSGKNFLLITEPGRINSYSYYLDGEQLVWQKGDEEPVSNSGMMLGFRKNVLKLVGDYPELAAKIEGKEKGYGMLNIQAIIKEYNTWYESKK